jgi:mycothiol synthase
LSASNFPSPPVSPLSAGFSSRPASHDDVEAVFALIAACDTHVLGEPDYDISEIRDDWRGISLEADTRVVEDADGAIVGYAMAADRTFVRPSGSVNVHPAAEDRGVGTWLTRWLEDRARTKLHLAPDGARVVLEFGASADYEPAVDLLTNEGYATERYFLRMNIDLATAALTPPAWPEGITVRTHNTGPDDEAVYEAVEESFSDHWGHTRESYERWRKHTVERLEWFAPELWFLAMSGNQIAGVALCSDYADMGQGWVNTVGVRRPWRRSGVALALLHHAFAEFYRRGRATVALGVDAQSLTGATRVYEKAGMHTKHRFALLTKELRHGVELTTQELS